MAHSKLTLALSIAVFSLTTNSLYASAGNHDSDLSANLDLTTKTGHVYKSRLTVEASSSSDTVDSDLKDHAHKFRELLTTHKEAIEKDIASGKTQKRADKIFDAFQSVCGFVGDLGNMLEGLMSVDPTLHLIYDGFLGAVHLAGVGIDVSKVVYDHLVEKHKNKILKKQNKDKYLPV